MQVVLPLGPYDPAEKLTVLEASVADRRLFQACGRLF